MKANKEIGFSGSGLKDFLESKTKQYNTIAFIADDPVSIPHRFSNKEDIEISAFLTAIISWGQRPVILKNAVRLFEMMDNAPLEFIIHAEKKDFLSFHKFVHRTYNGTDCIYFLKAMQQIYKVHGGLEKVFLKAIEESNGDMAIAISSVRNIFFSIGNPRRSSKHFADPIKNASAKRINMFLRWMVRKDKCKVDFGIWKSIKPSQLYCPLDVHSGRVARKLGILERKQDDWKAVHELTLKLRTFDKEDPIKYDFALFGLGVYEKF